jgi:hypothetical protein
MRLSKDVTMDELPSSLFRLLLVCQFLVVAGQVAMKGAQEDHSNHAREKQYDHD